MSAARGELKAHDEGFVWAIEHVDALRPFLVSLVSASDVWAYVSTSGGLTGGRRDAERVLFPYETDDRLHHAAGLTGPITLLRVGDVLWQPLDARGVAPGRVRRLRKSGLGHWLEFEEEAPDLGLVFRARWCTGPRFGLIRRCELAPIGAGPEGAVELLDGWLNLLPADVPKAAQETLSALVDAYKRAELLPGGRALFAMDARLSDQAAPAEALRANVVWRRGLEQATTLLSADAITDLRAGRPSEARTLWFGQRGAYLVRGELDLAAGPITWDLVGDVHLDHVGVVDWLRTLDALDDPEAALDADIADGERRLRALLAATDGFQHTADALATVHHTANVLFNDYRGGVPAHDYDVDVADVLAFLRERNRPVAQSHADGLRALGERVPHRELVAFAEGTGDDQLVRLALEYLPLFFGRRHGDPSRPWNAFSIRLRGPDGSPLYHYEGNWRDIFQNWEALCRSFPGLLRPVVAKFLSASTVDGFNPYRITREGVDWEVPDPEDPWANIGYWGDHQIVYLFRLLEAVEAHEPGRLAEWLGRDLFAYAAVPYRIRAYEALVRDAKESIAFDDEAEAEAEERVEALGTDGRLQPGPEGAVLQVNLLEKLLVTVLAKLSNLVVDGGIWMNTQRPEWNDANNALVGQGLSVVTLAQLRRALVFLRGLVADAGAHPVGREVVAWASDVAAVLADRSALDAGEPVSPAVRRQVLDRLGRAFSVYRAAAYDGLSGERQALDGAWVAALCDDALAWVEHSLRTTRRDDGLWHSYNVLALRDGEAHVRPLYEMLEGQVAVLGCGLLAPAEAVGVLDALFASRLYRDDQHSFLLYPFRDRPAFLDRNAVPDDVVAAAPLLGRLLEARHHGIVARDAGGTVRFDAAFGNATELGEALDALADEPAWSGAVAAGRAAVLDAYEATFDHLSFTGRSGTMYKYEGLGSIYWHMVSKLLLSVQEAWRTAHDTDDPAASALADHYYRVRRGLSFNKSVAEYGAVPTDPYSHTPWHLGAQQPGMTGQVKEEILTRLGELGVRVQAGRLRFDPSLLRRRELFDAPTVWRTVGPDGQPVEVDVPAGGLAFTLAAVPVVLTAGEAAHIVVHGADGRTVAAGGDTLDAATTARWLARDGSIRRVEVVVPGEALLDG